MSYFFVQPIEKLSYCATCKDRGTFNCSYCPYYPGSCVPGSITISDSTVLDRNWWINYYAKGWECPACGKVNNPDNKNCDCIENRDLKEFEVVVTVMSEAVEQVKAKDEKAAFALVREKYKRQQKEDGSINIEISKNSLILKKSVEKLETE